MGTVVYRFRSLSDTFEQRFSTIKLAMRKAYLDWVYKRYQPEEMVFDGKRFSFVEMKSYWEKEGWNHL
ncbi:hypothetical protein [Thermicanus aegyptius]|uniref:hypothetical protein n=1 Tax=Thermicanus aegyptius TaxID=94009 RepID=UPI00034AE1EF|nr:hypothetical protein [Thermicanus aegyptius]